MDSSSLSTITLDQVQKHKSSDDCWIVVHSKIYDVTDFHTEHPGGSAIILKYAGSDATVAYDEIHAPEILEETLPRENFIGFLDPKELSRVDTEHRTAPNSEETSQRATSPLQHMINKPIRYQKPELHTLISVHDFEKVAKNTFSAKAWAFYSSAATDLVTHSWNSDFYRKIMIRPRILRNVKNISIKRRIMGCESDAPFFVSPAAMAKLAHPDGECAIAKGCAAEGVIQCISSNASYSLATITASTPSQPFFLQLYVNFDRSKTAILLKKARNLGIKAIFVTVDAPVPGKREADERISAENVASAISGATASNDKKGGGMGRLMGQYIDSTLVWDDIRWIRATSGLPIVLKGVQSAEDVKKAVELGIEGVMLSNHGGRSIDTAQPAILTLLELHKYAPEVFGQIEIYLDGGITRGTDILKALALGATAVGVGRPYLYALAYGEAGVQHLTEILKDELETSMKLIGVTDVDHLHPGLLNTSMIDGLVSDGRNHPYIRWKPKALL